MLKPLITAALLSLPLPLLAETTPPPEAEPVLRGHILPGFAALAGSAARLSDAAQADCAPESDGLRSAWNAAFDDWLAVSHLRFGPTETDNRGFALAYWPDSRGTMPKALKKLFDTQDPIITSPGGMDSVSVAARGFYALEYLVFDPKYRADPVYACALTRALAADVAAMAGAISHEWAEAYGALLLTPGSAFSPYASAEKVRQELYKALYMGVQFTADMRLGRPLGSFDKPRPDRAEMRQAGRSQRNVALSVRALKSLAVILSEGDAALVADVTAAFDTAIAQAEALADDPVFDGVSDPGQRFKIEVLKQTLDLIKEQQLANIGNKLGVAAGFNALDGD
ncbi:imelysin family protein [Thalassovita sp.]|uniref:imelysin family protein n=1 Tax=Thalassovita sp. TaxID=1979401 RepID=UPI0029DE8CE0|nr:imelysin family protein [Thalassovita sp.]